MGSKRWQKFNPPPELAEVLESAPRVEVASTIHQLLDLACGGPESDYFEVAYDVPGRGRIVEATVARVRNGVAANYPEPYMRRRDPNTMVVADEKPSDKPSYQGRFGQDFEPVRQETFEWLKTQELGIFGFYAGQADINLPSMAVMPLNAGFFGLGLALLQGILPYDDLRLGFQPRSIIYAAPPFRHTHFDGKQVVVHNRRENIHEMFSYNLYPGPSAKKGIYGVLLNVGEKEGWVTAHCATVQVVTPYDNVVTFMHEGASGGGKSEMLEQPHREPDGRLLLGENVVTGERRFLEIPRTCELRPVTDDMALCHPAIQRNDRTLTLMDAESAWFVRVNHIDHYGVDPTLEGLTAQPPQPLLFLNIDAVPNSRALIWEHIEDEPGVPCPNPRVIIPRDIMPNAVKGTATVQIRSIGVRTPPCTKEKPTYGIIGLFHVLPPGLAWLWRLVAPRGHANPSIVATEGMSSEGVGSYWPFATGRRVDQANLLLRQFLQFSKISYILTPNQHVGAWKTGFMPQWLAREYLARRGHAQFPSSHVRPARCPLLGYTIYQLQVEGRMVPRWFLQVDTQPEVGEEAYDKGAEILWNYFQKNLKEFLVPDLMPLGRFLIQSVLDRGSLADIEALMPV